MAYPPKRHELYARLKTELSGAGSPHGRKLPTERDWAKNLGVARRTLRFVLERLERDGVIERYKSRGTFVGGIKKKSVNIPQVNVLLPCAEYLTAAGPYAFQHRRLVQGAMRGAVETGTQIVTLPVSKSNSPVGIDWQMLDHLNSESRVIMLGCWYKNLFPFLRERKCKVAILAAPHPWKEAVGDNPPSDWVVTFLDPDYSVRQLAGFLFASGCRRVAAVWSLNTNEMDGLRGFRQACLAAGATFNPACFTGYQDSAFPNLEKIQRQTRFDGLVLAAAIEHPPRLPSNVKFLSPSALLPELNLPPDRSFSYSLDTYEAAYLMTKALYGREKACNEKRFARYEIRSALDIDTSYENLEPYFW